MPVFLKNGEEVRVNDHVYCSPVWSVRDGTPYSVARIMEFLQPEGTEKARIQKNGYYDRVRLAWYYRPSDVSDRPVADTRLLLAAIYSEVCDINQLRAKCHVVHRDRITDLAGWKRRPDRFYFNRLFDPYIKKEFDVMPATDVRNVPDHIRDTLISRYEYVVAEKEVVPDLTDAIRLCDTCHDWCPSPDTVQCDRCKKYFHMACVQPPLLAKPSRGYGWTCAPCSRKHEEEVDSHVVRHVTPTAPPKPPKSNAPAPRGRGRPRKDRTLAEKEERLPVKHYKMWPFRYFGQHTVAEDTLDPDDFIFPRTATRVGPKYQANVPAGIDEPGPSDVDERGGDSTIEVLSILNELTEVEVADLDILMDRLTEDQELRHNVDWLTETTRRYSAALASGVPLSVASVNMMSAFRMEKWKKCETRFTDKPWTADESTAFEDGIVAHGAELRAVRDDVGTRSMPEVVRFYAHWKNSKLGEQNAMTKNADGVVKNDVPSHPPVLEHSSGNQTVGLKDDEGSVIEETPRVSYSCGACRTHESKKWWKAPKGLVTSVLCDNCGTNWRKYADINVRPQREESVPSGKGKREGTPLLGPSAKRTRTSISAQSTPPPSHGVPQVRCVLCQRNGPMGKVMKCKKCQFRIHAGSCGAKVDPAKVDSWMCELCQNENTLEASLKSDCLLCPRVRTDGKHKTFNPPPDSFLRACKPTEGQGWAHVLCSVFTPELSFTDSSRLRVVEGISIIPHHRWATACRICGQTEGAVVRCSDCTKEYHVSCAWKRGHKFGFEMQPVKSSRRDTVSITTFRGETGSMNPVISCKDHPTSRRDIYDLCDTNDGGETALQVYCTLYKQAPVTQAHDLLRKARRLDQILDVRSDASLSSVSTGTAEVAQDPQCYRCQTTFSPLFYRFPPFISSFMANFVPGARESRWLCHKCHFKTRETTGESSSTTT